MGVCGKGVKRMKNNTIEHAVEALEMGLNESKYHNSDQLNLLKSCINYAIRVLQDETPAAHPEVIVNAAFYMANAISNDGFISKKLKGKYVDALEALEDYHVDIDSLRKPEIVVAKDCSNYGEFKEILIHNKALDAVKKLMEGKIMFDGYIIVDRREELDLEQAVTRKMEEGWQPLGGVSAIRTGNNNTMFYQAMAKPVINKPTKGNSNV